MLRSIFVASLAVGLAGPAFASTDDAWAEFESKVGEACVAAAGELVSDPEAIVDPFGSQSYGLALVTGDTSEGQKGVICVFDKQTEAVEIGGELDLSAVGGRGDEAGGTLPLEEILEADLESAALNGELACSFATGNTPPLLFAMGVVGSDEPAEAIAKVGGELQRSSAPGGFNAMVEGARFEGDGGTYEIAVTGETEEGGESPARLATLTVELAGGDTTSVDGVWRCGP